MNTYKISSIKKRIEDARRQLDALVEKSSGEGLASDALLDASEQLDKLLNEYRSLLEDKKY